MLQLLWGQTRLKVTVTALIFLHNRHNQSLPLFIYLLQHGGGCNSLSMKYFWEHTGKLLGMYIHTNKPLMNLCAWTSVNGYSPHGHFMNGLKRCWKSETRWARWQKENAPGVILHLFQVRLLSTVSLLLKHMGSSHFFLFCHLPLDTGISPSVSVTAADGSTILWWMQTNIKCLPSRPAHLIEMQLECMCQYEHTVC